MWAPRVRFNQKKKKKKKKVQRGERAERELGPAHQPNKFGLAGWLGKRLKGTARRAWQACVARGSAGQLESST